LHRILREGASKACSVRVQQTFWPHLCDVRSVCLAPEIRHVSSPVRDEEILISLSLVGPDWWQKFLINATMFFQMIRRHWWVSEPQRRTPWKGPVRSDTHSGSHWYQLCMIGSPTITWYGPPSLAGKH
jgi:hypothetical protein